MLAREAAVKTLNKFESFIISLAHKTLDFMPRSFDLPPQHKAFIGLIYNHLLVNAANAVIRLSERFTYDGRGLQGPLMPSSAQNDGPKAIAAYSALSGGQPPDIWGTTVETGIKVELVSTARDGRYGTTTQMLAISSDINIPLKDRAAILNTDNGESYLVSVVSSSSTHIKIFYQDNIREFKYGILEPLNFKKFIYLDLPLNLQANYYYPVLIEDSSVRPWKWNTRLLFGKEYVTQDLNIKPNMENLLFDLSYFPLTRVKLDILGVLPGPAIATLNRTILPAENLPDQFKYHYGDQIAYNCIYLGNWNTVERQNNGYKKGFESNQLISLKPNSLGKYLATLNTDLEMDGLFEIIDIENQNDGKTFISVRHIGGNDIAAGNNNSNIVPIALIINRCLNVDEAMEHRFFALNNEKLDLYYKFNAFQPFAPLLNDLWYYDESREPIYDSGDIWLGFLPSQNNDPNNLKIVKLVLNDYVIPTNLGSGYGGAS